MTRIPLLCTGLIALGLCNGLPEPSLADAVGPAGEEPGAAQAGESSRDATSSVSTTSPVPDYFLPDAPPELLVYETRNFWFKPILAIVTDYTFFEQDDLSLAQVGEQEDTPDLRAARMGSHIQIRGEREKISAAMYRIGAPMTALSRARTPRRTAWKYHDR